MSGVGRARAVRELEETTAELEKARAVVARLLATRDRRIVRAVELGVSRPDAARLAKVARQRVWQLVPASNGEVSE